MKRVQSFFTGSHRILFPLSVFIIHRLWPIDEPFSSACLPFDITSRLTVVFPSNRSFTALVTFKKENSDEDCSDRRLSGRVPHAEVLREAERPRGDRLQRHRERSVPPRRAVERRRSGVADPAALPLSKRRDRAPAQAQAHKPDGARDRAYRRRGLYPARDCRLGRRGRQTAHDGGAYLGTDIGRAAAHPLRGKATPRGTLAI